ncbi:hypothetical protein [Bradyrhizobium sp. URHD0069]|jgi:hypothetical protein|uniref:hypothetical protein n=1 Tax=Bradyrhizobium sp. URHD0069 TaxID=1380355 RepID=UPI0004957299|nr:hypothetical protein [Bradyrhizobium sp. URHD0069]
MRDFNQKHRSDVLREAEPRYTVEGRSWLANAIINSVAAKSAVDDPTRERQTVQAPAIVRYFGRTRRTARRSAFSLMLRATILSTVCLISICFSHSDAPAGCGEGKTTAGQCVNSGLAETARQAAVIFSQPKISQTAYPVLPSSDPSYRYPHQLNSVPLKASATGVLAPN